MLPGAQPTAARRFNISQGTADGCHERVRGRSPHAAAPRPCSWACSAALGRCPTRGSRPSDCRGLPGFSFRRRFGRGQYSAEC
eukprot:4265810-Pyramimonas_sp.AAC.1